MPKDYSPFTPGLPVPIEFFVGRLTEVERLRGTVKNAVSADRLQVAFISGERGIGKSSLVSFVRHITEHEDRVLGIHTHLGGVTTLEEMVRRIFDRLAKQGAESEWWGKVKELFGKHVSKVGLFSASVEFRAPGDELRSLVRNFAPALRNLAKHLKGDKEGLFIILDDINGLAESPVFADWLKSLVDEIATSADPLPLCLTFVGLEERRQSLIEGNPSLARVFDLIDIPAWENEETRGFFKTAFDGVGVSAEEAALDLLTRYAGGLPVLAHEIGDAVFKADKDNLIDRGDALSGIVVAADVVGRKHLEPRVFRAIRSQRYRAILRKMAKTPVDIEFKRGDLMAKLSREEAKVSDNFLRKMKEMGVLQSDPERGPGAYRFQNRLHYLYFWLEAEGAKESRES